MKNESTVEIDLDETNVSSLIKLIKISDRYSLMDMNKLIIHLKNKVRCDNKELVKVLDKLFIPDDRSFKLVNTEEGNKALFDIIYSIILFTDYNAPIDATNMNDLLIEKDLLKYMNDKVLESLLLCYSTANDFYSEKFVQVYKELVSKSVKRLGLGLVMKCLENRLNQKFGDSLNHEMYVKMIYNTINPIVQDIILIKCDKSGRYTATYNGYKKIN